MDLTAQNFYFVDKILYKALGEQGTQFGEYEVDYIYLCKLDKETVPYEAVPEEVCEVEWVAKSELKQFIEDKEQSGCVFSPWFLKMYNNGLLDKWWQIA